MGCLILKGTPRVKIRKCCNRANHMQPRCISARRTHFCDSEMGIPSPCHTLVHQGLVKWTEDLFRRMAVFRSSSVSFHPAKMGSFYRKSNPPLAQNESKSTPTNMACKELRRRLRPFPVGIVRYPPITRVLSAPIIRPQCWFRDCARHRRRPRSPLRPRQCLDCGCGIHFAQLRSPGMIFESPDIRNQGIQPCLLFLGGANRISSINPTVSADSPAKKKKDKKTMDSTTWVSSGLRFLDFALHEG